VYRIRALLVGVAFIKGMLYGGVGETKLVLRLLREKYFSYSPVGGGIDGGKKVGGHESQFIFPLVSLMICYTSDSHLRVQVMDCEMC
jgi:hypothetical protein